MKTRGLIVDDENEEFFTLVDSIKIKYKAFLTRKIEVPQKLEDEKSQFTPEALASRQSMFNALIEPSIKMDEIFIVSTVKPAKEYKNASRSLYRGISRNSNNW